MKCNTRKWGIVLWLVLCLVVPSLAGAATVYVSAAAAGSAGDGSEAAPFAIIQDGLDVAISGDTVLVLPGIYYGTMTLKNGVRLLSQEGPASTIIDGMGENVVIRSGSGNPAWCSLEGFSVRNGNVLLDVWNYVNFWGYTFMLVDNCIMYDANMAVYTGPSAHLEMTRTVIKNSNGNLGIGVFGIWSNGSLKNTTMDKLNLAIATYDAGFEVLNTTISNVAAVREVEGHSASTWGSNNNFWNYGELIRSYPQYWNTYNYFTLTSTIETNPLFVDAAVGDYRLQQGSPLIDAGVNVGLTFEGSAPDIGARETNASLLSMTEGLAESYQRISGAAFKNVADQRKNALHNKFMAIIRMLTSVNDTMTDRQKLDIYQGALNKLMNDIHAKADGSLGGDPKNDWITDPDEQLRLDEKVQLIAETLRTRIAALTP